jgi:molybdopterin converting factor small subunit
VRVLYFAQARLTTGRSEEAISTFEPMTAESFWKVLIQKYPSLLPLKSSCRIAKNGFFLQPGQKLDPHDEVAVLPPVSGG